MLSEIDNRPFPSIPPRFNMAGYVLARAAGLSKPALTILHPDRDETIDYADLLCRVRGTATALLSLGLIAGDRLLLRLDNSVSYPVVYLGAIWAGLVPVPTSAALTLRELATLAAIIRPKVIIADAPIDVPDCAAPVLRPDVRAWGQLPPGDLHLADPDREAYVVFTSGTSGTPLAVSHAHRAILSRVTMRDHWEGLTADDRLLHVGALNWTYAMGTGVLDPLTVGATALILPTGTPVASLPALVRRSGATILAAVPGIYRQLLRADVSPFPTLRHGLSAGEALSASLRRAWRDRTETDLHEALGMTEISTFVSGSPGSPVPDGLAGRVQPARHVAVLGDDDKPVSLGQPGELAVATADPGMMRGYLHAAPLAGTWFRTGDIVTMAEDGAITHVGRKDDLVNAGGFRISPVEIEAAFSTMPGMDACAAITVEPAPGISLLALFYEAGDSVREDDLHRHAEMSLARWKQPRHYQRVQALPRTTNGKIIRHALKSCYARPE